LRLLVRGFGAKGFSSSGTLAELVGPAGLGALPAGPKAPAGSGGAPPGIAPRVEFGAGAAPGTPDGKALAAWALAAMAATSFGAKPARVVGPVEGRMGGGAAGGGADVNPPVADKGAVGTTLGARTSAIAWAARWAKAFGGNGGATLLAGGRFEIVVPVTATTAAAVSVMLGARARGVPGPAGPADVPDTGIFVAGTAAGGWSGLGIWPAARGADLGPLGAGSGLGICRCCAIPAPVAAGPGTGTLAAVLGLTAARPGLGTPTLGLAPAF
jgi:hypothetical protein